MSGRYLLDMNVIIALIAKVPATHEHIATAAEVFIPSIALGELYFGANKSQRVQENILRIEEFAVNNTVLARDVDTARRYGESRISLKPKGSPFRRTIFGSLLLRNNMPSSWCRMMLISS